MPGTVIAYIIDYIIACYQRPTQYVISVNMTCSEGMWWLVFILSYVFVFVTTKYNILFHYSVSAVGPLDFGCQKNDSRH